MRELRLAFAMGGGVSLGTFSGAALSQALKLAILRGVDAGGTPYDKVVVDVFSGASAGAMALAIMLRSLVARTEMQEKAAEARLREEFGGEFTRLDECRRADLVAAQVMQDVQREIWGEEVTIEGLLGLGSDGSPISSTRARMRSTAGVLDRGFLEELARGRLGFDEKRGLGDRRVLSDRVLFACALSNLTPIVADARHDLDAVDVGMRGLLDGLTSRTHRELRVFDLNFTTLSAEEVKDPNIYPRRWIRYHADAKVEGKFGSLTSQRCWGRIAATVIAAGAFPGAFEPVVLERMAFEYGADSWPPELAGKTSYNFTFVDGGVFNNEPIREAFRMAAHIDAQYPEELCDRRIIFVDPAVDGDGPTVLDLPVHRRTELRRRSFFGLKHWYETPESSSLDRLLPHLGSLGVAILDEARAIEDDKVFLTRKRFELRDRVRSYITSLPPIPADNARLRGLQLFIVGILRADTINAAIPAGGLTLRTELRRVLTEEHACENDPARKALLGQMLANVESLVPTPKRGPIPHLDELHRMLLFIAMDLAMGLEGKHANSKLIAIAPMIDVASGSDARIVRLPGGLVYGFGGFTSRIPGRFEIPFARRCAREFLEGCGLITPATPLGNPPSREPVGLTEEEEASYRKDLHRGLGLLGARIAAMLAESHMMPLPPFIDRIALHIVGGLIEKKMRELEPRAEELVGFDFEIIVPDDRFVIGTGRGASDRIEPIGGNGGWRIPLRGSCALNGSDGQAPRWAGPFIAAGPDRIELHRNGRLFCYVLLPPSARLREARSLPGALFRVGLLQAHEGAAIGDGAWELVSTVTPLDMAIFPEK